MGDGLGKDLKVWFCNGDRKAQKETDSEDQWEIFGARQGGSDLISDRCHRLLGSQGEKAHTDDQYQGSDKECQEKIRLHRGNVQAQKKDDDDDWQNGK